MAIESDWIIYELDQKFLNLNPTYLLNRLKILILIEYVY